MNMFICISTTQSSLQELNRSTVAAFLTRTRRIFFYLFIFAKENSLWSFDSWKRITEIFQQPAKKKIINMHSTKIIHKERRENYTAFFGLFGLPSLKKRLT